jgi:hypothetical protein
MSLENAHQQSSSLVHCQTDPRKLNSLTRKGTTLQAAWNIGIGDFSACLFDLTA